MEANTVELFCVILQEIHPKCSLELVLFILISGVAPNPNHLLPQKISLRFKKRHQNSAPLDIN